jgi:hypothetical protein
LVPHRVFLGALPLLSRPSGPVRLALIVGIDPIHAVRAKVAADGTAYRREKLSLSDQREKSKTLQFIFYRIFQFGEAQFDPGII